MHNQPMAEHDGKTGAPEASGDVCVKCNSTNVISQMWESSCGGYDDVKLTCKSCGHVRWIDGIDS